MQFGANSSLTLKDILFRGKRYDIRVERGTDGKPKLTRASR
ncbi:MAG: hypothetical protein ACYC7G_06735 [Rudaea sp.]